MSNQAKSTYWNYLIDPAFNKVNRIFVLSSKRKEDKIFFSKYYTPKVEIKSFNILIARKCSSNVPVKNKEESYKKIIELSNNNGYTTGNLVGYE